MPQQRMFLERRSYRKRRMMDAMRVLPVVGLCLWLVPMMWPVGVAQGDSSAVSTSAALRYIFCIWILLSVGAWLLWRRTRRDIASEDTTQTPSKVPR
jgi:ABC-type nickel/cobalt efflux system permease component RcnA